MRRAAQKSGGSGGTAAGTAARMEAEMKPEETTVPEPGPEAPPAGVGDEDDVLRIAMPDDFHHHFRDGAALAHTVPHVVRRFRRAIAMPNLKPPVRTTEDARAYRQRILDAVPATLADAGAEFQPLMTLYLTDNTTADEIERAVESGIVYAVKLYPAGATTNSDFGITDMNVVNVPALSAMERLGLPLLIHGEVTDGDVDVFDREATFIERVLTPLVHRHPDLKVVLEHMTTEDAVRFVEASGPNVAGTITAHHLLYNRNAIFAGGIRPHMYCLPVLKRERHRTALVAAATSGNPKFFIGTDSAPHVVDKKTTGCGCAGIFTAHAAIELYTEVFDAAGALDKLEAFASHHGADFYGLPRTTDATITLRRQPWIVPEVYPLGDQGEMVVPLRAGEQCTWTLVEAPGLG